MKIIDHPLNPVNMETLGNKIIHLEQDGNNNMIRLCRLMMPQKYREEALLKATITMLAMMKYFGNISIGLNIISRDDPWDFEMIDNNGNKFYIEITEFTDRVWFHQEETKSFELDEMISTKKAEYSKIKKVIEYFDLKIKIPENPGKGNNKKIIKNPIFNYKREKFWFRNTKSKSNFESLEEAILKKENKKHDKSNCILILDNRSIYFNAFHYNKLRNKISNLDFSFMGIFVITAYGTRYNDVEFTAFPLWLSKKMDSKITIDGDVMDGNSKTEKEKEKIIKNLWVEKWKDT